MKTPTARTTMASFFDTTTNLWSDAFLAGRGVILTLMTTATTMAGERVDSDKDVNTTKTPTVRTTTTSYFDTTTNLWSDAFLAGRGVDFDDDDNGNNDHKYDNDDDSERGKRQRHRRQGQQRPHFLTQQPTCGWMHSWQGGGGISTTMDAFL